MNTRKRYEALAEHFKLDRKQPWSKLVSEIKKAAHATSDDNAETLYDRIILKKSPPKVIEGTAIEVKDEPTKPASPAPAPTNSTTAVDVKAPTIAVNIPAPNVTVHTSANGTWFALVERAVSRGFVFGSGLLLGVLVSKHILRVVGLS